ncbi:CDP-glycerol glycerophosphotransferase family protein [Dysgonomonas sp. 25]|uniref:CDP-glycerol glycerophosphotransferase family protein n=1 Tax=Dysgonomonas sp. 25 TaxID=2302933 RepID=UPI0013D1C5F4|nr:CDP-glycerol glycerophosphotransferase family protein [Dysgonomonas sp. 25]NDV70436.1 CDP-glycerol--poly(glycerophosphate) glycerophosphotransferase [Dysgonomonas sp. 25]
MKKYLFFASLSYSFSILRPLQEEIRRRGGEAAWYLEPECDNWLEEDEIQLKTIEEVMEYNPIAVFAAGNYVYDFFPGVKVAVFHGYAMNKRADKIDDHFSIRGWFDIYCTQGPSSTPYFKELEKKYGWFKVYESGWCKVDPFFDGTPEKPRERPAILYSPTFSKTITSAYKLYDTIVDLIKTKPWDWIITFHPKLDDPELIARYKELSEQFGHVAFFRSNDGLNTFRKIDVMLCDSSSIIVEVEMLNKPVVTFCNTTPGPYLIDVLKEEDVAPALERALTRPPELMQAMLDYTMYHEVHRDGRNSQRVLDAVDDFILNYKGKLKKKRPGIIRKWKLWRKAGYCPLRRKKKGISQQ